MKDLSNITVNGQPLQQYVNAEIAVEANRVRNEYVAEKRGHRPSCGSKFRNVSGSRSGRGRVIFSAGGAA